MKWLYIDADAQKNRPTHFISALKRTMDYFINTDVMASSASKIIAITTNML